MKIGKYINHIDKTQFVSILEVQQRIPMISFKTYDKSILTEGEDYLPLFNQQHVSELYRCVREYNSNIPDNALDEMKHILESHLK
jgi:hypothetical protein